MKELPILFLDANIFFAAVSSKTGGSFFIVELAKQGRFVPATAAHALAEAERNIKIKLGEAALRQHHENVLAIYPYIPSFRKTDKKMEEIVSKYVPKKDIPIVLGALESHADFLITLDRKHLLDNEDLKWLFDNLSIITPGDFLQNHFKM